MDCSKLGFPVLHYLLQFAQIHAHWVGDAIQPSHPLLLPSHLLSIFPNVRFFSNESALPIRCPKYWSFSFSICPFNEHSGLISFRIDWFDLFAVQGTFKSLFQHHSSKTSILWCSAFFMLQLSYSCLGNLMERGAWQGTGHRFSKNQTSLKQLSMHSRSHPYMTTGKTIVLTIQTCVGKMLSLFLKSCLGLA